MALRVPIPTLYNVSDNDVGDMSFHSGNEYDIEDIKISEYYDKIDGSPPSIGDNASIRSSFIDLNRNQWAAFRPWNRTSPGPLGPEVTSPNKRDIYGFSITDGNIGGVERKIISDTLGYRLGWVGGYNHTATPTILLSEYFEFIDKDQRTETINVQFQYGEFTPLDWGFDRIFILTGTTWNFDNVFNQDNLNDVTNQGTKNYGINLGTTHTVSWNNPIKGSVWFGINTETQRYRWTDPSKSAFMTNEFEIEWVWLYQYQAPQKADGGATENWGPTDNLNPALILDNQKELKTEWQIIFNWNVNDGGAIPNNEDGITTTIWWSETDDETATRENEQVFEDVNQGTYTFNVLKTFARDNNMYFFFTRTGNPL